MANLTVKQGKNVVLLFRELAKQGEEAAWKLAFQTEHSIPISVDTDTVETKDGNVQVPKEPTYDPSATSLMADGDKRIKELRKATLERQLFEFWEIDKIEKDESGKFAATYYQGYVTSFEPSAPVDGAVEVSMNFAFNGIGKDGFATLTAEQEKVTQYEFEDTVKKGE